MRRYFTTLLFLLCNLLCFAQIIVNPVYDRTSFEVLHPHVDKVELKKDSTKIYCSINYQESWSYNIPKTMFVENLKDNKKYRITKCIGLPFEPEERAFDYGGSFQFIFCFPYIEGLQKFNLIEDSTKDRFFNIYGIDLSTSFSKAYDEIEYKRLKNLSDFYKSSNDINKFAEFKEKELFAAQFVFGIKSLAADACYYQLAQYYNVKNEYAKAIDFGLKALECDSIHLGVRNKVYPVYVNTLSSLSFFYRNAGKDTEALQCRQKCINISRELENEEKYIQELRNLLLSEQNRKDEIRKRLDIVSHELNNLPIFINTNSLLIFELYKDIASSYFECDNYKKAIESTDKALMILENNRMIVSEEFADILRLKSHYQKNAGQAKAAIDCGENSKSLYDSLGIRSDKYANLLEDLASAYSAVLNYEKSIQLDIIAAEIYKANNDWRSLIGTYADLSETYRKNYKLNDAELYIKKAIDILNEHGDAKKVNQSDIENSGNQLLNNPHSLSAIEYFINVTRLNCLHILVMVYRDQGKIEEAFVTALEIDKTLKALGDNHLYALHLSSLSELYFKKNQQSEAIKCAERSVQLLDGDSLVIPALLMLANIYFQTGDTIKAIQHAKESVAKSKSLDIEKDRIRALSSLSFYYCKNRNFKEGEQCLSEALNFLKRHIVNEITRMTKEQKQRIWSNYDYLFLLYRNMIEGTDRNGKYLSKLYDYILFSKNFLLDNEIQNSVYEQSYTEITWEAIQQHLSDDDIAIEFFSTNRGANYYSYHALIIDKNSPYPSMITLFSEDELDKKKLVDNRNVQDIVGDLIWKPIVTQYRDARNIFFSPDGIFHLLPIEYYNVDITKNMFDNYNMYRLSSTKELTKKHDNQLYQSAALYGGLDYNQLRRQAEETHTQWRGIANRGGFDPLFNTLEEIKEIDTLLTKNNVLTKLFSGESGTEDSFRKISCNGVNIVHLATHGMYINQEDLDIWNQTNDYDFIEFLGNDKNPVKEDIALTHSFLVMSGGNENVYRDSLLNRENDGILTAKDISQLNLKGLDLVVLSACETALGDVYNDGIYGLQRGFKKAGANTILMSLNKVDDEATRILMVEFYRNLMNGKTKRQSLQEAQQYLRKVENRKYDDPKYWASFIMLDGLN